jgi:hypothetical protein
MHRRWLRATRRRIRSVGRPPGRRPVCHREHAARREALSRIRARRSSAEVVITSTSAPASRHLATWREACRCATCWCWAPRRRELPPARTRNRTARGGARAEPGRGDPSDQDRRGANGDVRSPPRAIAAGEDARTRASVPDDRHQLGQPPRELRNGHVVVVADVRRGQIALIPSGLLGHRDRVIEVTSTVV